MPRKAYPARMLRMLAAIALALPTGVPAAAAQEVPVNIVRQLPPGYTILRAAAATFGTPAHRFYFIALGRRQETAMSPDAQPRPLLIFARRADGSYTLAARNDHVVLRADQGGQCDPFEDGAIVAKGMYVTIENSIACGFHWTHYVTFRFDPRLGWVFDTLRTESWTPNPRDDGDALVSEGMHVVRAVAGRPVRFAAWRAPGE